MLEKWTILVFGSGLVAKGEDKPRIWDRRKFGDVTVWRPDSASHSDPESGLQTVLVKPSSGPKERQTPNEQLMNKHLRQK